MRGEEDITVVARDVLSCQPCGCDLGYRNGIVLGHYCANYPKCAWGKSQGTSIPSGDKIARSLGLVPGTLAQQPSAYSDKSKHVGIGGAPTRATTLPDDPKERKTFPIVTGLLDYFPDALAAVANVSWTGNEQHNPGKPLHWDRSKSADEADTLGRHLLQRGTLDKDGKRHSAKVAWRALALLQKEIESERV